MGLTFILLGILVPVKVLAAGAGETAHWLRTLVALPEDPSLAPGPRV